MAVRTVLLTLLAAGASLHTATRAQTPPGRRDSGSNEIVCENSKPGSPQNDWDVIGAGDRSIQGFGSDIGVDAGQTIASRSTRRRRTIASTSTEWGTTVGLARGPLFH